MRHLLNTSIFLIIASVAFSQKDSKCILDLRDDYAFVEYNTPINILVFKNDKGVFNMADAKILELPGCGPYHGFVADPDTDCFTYNMNHINCDGEIAPSPTHPFNYLDTFEYYVQVPCEDYCNPGDGKIWTITSEYLGEDDADRVVVYTKKGVYVGEAGPLHKGDIFTIEKVGEPLPNNTTDWDYTFYFDESTETVRVHTSCSQLIFNVDFGLLMPISGCIATYDEYVNGACDMTTLQRDKVKVRSSYIFPRIISDTAMVIIETAVLPIYILDFSVTTKRNDNHLSWSITNVTNEQYISLEKSYDGIAFTELERFTNLSNGDYSYIDPLYDRSVKMHYYRLAITDINGEVSYSNVIMGRQRIGYESHVLVYPNPSAGMVTVELLDDGLRLMSLSLDDIAGKRIMYIPLDHNKSITLSLEDESELKGVFIISVELNSGEVVHKKILLTQ